MRPALTILALMLASAVCCAQSGDGAQADKQSSARAAETLAAVRAALGGEARLKAVRALSLSGKYRRRTAAGEVAGEIKIDLLLPDKFLKAEQSRPQPMTFVTVTQAVNGAEAWVDRQVSRASRDDGAGEIAAGPAASSTTVAAASAGMRGATNGQTTVRTNTPGVEQTERTVLGMRIPTPQGRDLNTDAAKLEQANKAAAAAARPGSRPPGYDNPEVRAALERQARREFACLSLAWLLTSPPAFPLALVWGEEIKADGGRFAALDATGPEDFAARLFVDRRTHRPVMVSYRATVSRGAGYVVAAPGDSGSQTDAAGVEEVAVRFHFADYRAVEGVWLPHHIVKTVNGAPVDEWKVEKYKINPDLKPKKFEKK
jgi:hypothetical protein